MGQDVDSLPSISISDYELDAVCDFVYLGSTISDSLALDMEINKRIGKTATIMSRLTKRVWTNGKLTEHTKIQVYRACALSTLLYGNELWTLRARRALGRACGTHGGRQDPQGSPLRYAGRRQTPDSQTPIAIQKRLQKRLEGHGCRPHQVGSCSLRLDGLEADCALRNACPPLNSHSHNRLRQREKGERPEGKLTYPKRISLGSSAAGIATPASDFPVIPDPDSASVSPPREQLHSLPRLMDAKD